MMIHFYKTIQKIYNFTANYSILPETFSKSHKTPYPRTCEIVILFPPRCIENKIVNLQKTRFEMFFAVDSVTQE